MPKSSNDERSNPAGSGQISLFGVRETPEPYRKAIQVLHSKPKVPLSLLQSKLGDAWLKHAIENESSEDGWWEISLAELARSVGFDSKNGRYLRENALALMRIVFEWDVIAPTGRRVTWKASVLFPEVEVSASAVRYQISKQMRDRVLHPDVYALIDMAIERRFRRAASVRIWQFCVRFERVRHTARVPWEDFRDMVLGEEAGESKTFQEYKFFKNRVLLPAIVEINSESNHTIQLIETKIGKRVSMLQFDVERKATVEAVIEDDQSIELISELVKLGVPVSEARKICRTHPRDDVRGALDYTRRRAADKRLSKLEKPAAYFRQALANKYAPAVGDLAEADKKPSATAGGKNVSIAEAFAAHRASEAKRYFEELDPDDQAKMLERYNAAQATPSLKVGKKPSKLAQSAFFGWLAVDTWGDATQDELLEHAQRMLTARGAG